MDTNSIVGIQLRKEETSIRPSKEILHCGLNKGLLRAPVLIITDEKLRQAILEALADRESLKILDAAVFHARSINEIIRETGIAHTTAYRKVNMLLDKGLLVVERTKITPDGKKYSEVRSTLRSFNVKYDLGELVVESVQNYSPVEATAEKFFSIGR